MSTSPSLSLLLGAGALALGVVAILRFLNPIRLERERGKSRSRESSGGASSGDSGSNGDCASDAGGDGGGGD